MRSPPAGSTKDFAIGLGLQRHRAHRADEAERDMHHVIAGRQHEVRRRVAILADHLEGAGVIRPVGKDAPHQSAIDEGQVLAVARRQRQHRLSRCAAPGGVGGTAAIDGWVRTGGRLDGTAPAGGGAPLRARGRRQTDRRAGIRDGAGGTGGGRSLNIWALAGGAETASKTATRAPATAARRAGHRMMPSPPEFIPLLFTENAANSSLQAPSFPGETAAPGTGQNLTNWFPGSRSRHNSA